MKKLTRKDTAKINGGIGIDQCYYIDDNGLRKLGCRLHPFQDENGSWIYPLVPCGECFGL